MSASSTNAATSNSGIQTDSSTGERHIPSSTRADGSKRKEIRIRPGYRPPEDVEVYKNRTAQAFKSRGTGGGVPGAEGLKDDNDLTENSFGAAGKSNKNAKRREARRRAKAAEGGKEEEDGESTKGEEENDGEAVKENGTGATKKEDAAKLENGEMTKEDQERIEREKRARKLRKKLREARELQEKKEKGEVLLHEQFEKVIRINELIRDLDKLGFDANGEPKEQ